MIKSIIPICLSISLLAASNNASFAADVNADEFKSAIQAVVADGIIKSRNSRAVFDLNWNLLPVTEGLIQNQIKLDNIKKEDSPISITFTQKSKNSILCDLRAEDQVQIYKALGVDEKNSSCDRLQPRNIMVSGSGNQKSQSIRDVELDKIFGGASSIQSSDYVAMTLERNILKTILTSKGIKYDLNLRAGEELDVPNFSDKNITWKINIYKNRWFDVGQEEINYYRFSIKAKVDRIERNNFSLDKKSVAYDARIAFKDSETLTRVKNPYFSVDKLGQKVTLVENPTFKAETATAQNQIAQSLSSLSGIFNIFGGGEQLSNISQGLFSGTDNSSIVSGGLFNFKNGNVDPLIGINREITNIGDASVGLVYGVGLGQKTSIFLGPSIQESIFTLSAGATLGAGQQSEIGFAGLVSVDLSRATNSKKDINTVELKNPPDTKTNAERNIRTEIEKDIRNNILIRYRNKAVCNKPKIFRLEKDIDSKISVEIDSQNKEPQLAYLPRGNYKVVDSTPRAPSSKEIKIPLVEDIPEEIVLDLDCS
jgi:hypothetical protein